MADIYDTLQMKLVALGEVASDLDDTEQRQMNQDLDEILDKYDR